MSTAVLNNLVAGFDHEAYGSQAVFRTTLNALSHPGRIWDMPLDMSLPQQGQAAAAGSPSSSQSVSSTGGSAAGSSSPSSTGGLLTGSSCASGQASGSAAPSASPQPSSCRQG